MNIVIKAKIKITLSKSVKPTKKIRNFYIKKKDVKGFLGSQEFFGNIAGKKRWFRWWHRVTGGRV